MLTDADIRARARRAAAAHLAASLRRWLRAYADDLETEDLDTMTDALALLEGEPRRRNPDHNEEN